MHIRTSRTLFIVAAVLLLLAVAIFLRSKAPHEAARLLPEYQQFVDATGIEWERDLDQAAVDPRLRGWAEHPQSVLPSEKPLAKSRAYG
jgi:hypothetical protein